MYNTKKSNNNNHNIYHNNHAFAECHAAASEVLKDLLADPDQG